jgi:hypothetical protein
MALELGVVGRGRLRQAVEPRAGRIVTGEELAPACADDVVPARGDAERQERGDCVSRGLAEDRCGHAYAGREPREELVALERPEDDEGFRGGAVDPGEPLCDLVGISFDACEQLHLHLHVRTGCARVRVEET